jgi:hypothetical protein
MSNSNGVRIDRYTLKNGKIVTCSTTVGTVGPTMDCDNLP